MARMMMPDYLTEIRDDQHFESFAKAYLEAAGIKVIEGPGLGPDGGRDLIAEERLPSRVGDEIYYRWFVSCKYWKVAVGVSKENGEYDIMDRLIAAKCNGFIGFYSSGKTSGLEKKVREMRDSSVNLHLFDFKFYDGDGILQAMHDPRYINDFAAVAQQYLPKFYNEVVEPKLGDDPLAKMEQTNDQK